MLKFLITSLLLIPIIAVAQNIQPPENSPPVSRPNTSNTDQPEGFDPGGAEINIITEGEKTIEEYDFAFHPNLDKQTVMQLFDMDFMTQKENIIFLGLPGRSVNSWVPALLHQTGYFFVGKKQIKT